MKISAIEERKRSIQINDMYLECYTFPQEQNSVVFDTTLHTHPYAELFYCSKGSIQLKIENDKITLGENDLAIVPSGLNHIKLPDSSNSNIWGSICLSCDKIKINVRECESIYSSIEPLMFGNEITIVRNNPTFCISSHKIHLNSAQGVMEIFGFAYDFCEAVKGKATEKIVVSDKINRKDIDRLIILDQIIGSEYMNNLSNEEIADRMFLSKRQLSRFVLANLGAPLHSIITDRRLSRAATLLSETDWGIERIYQSVGFKNKTFFYEKFKEKFNATPVRYRKNQIEKV